MEGHLKKYDDQPSHFIQRRVLEVFKPIWRKLTFYISFISGKYSYSLDTF